MNALTLSVASLTLCLSQVDDNEARIVVEQLRIGFVENGSPVVYTAEYFATPPIDDKLQLLFDMEIASELEMSDEQLDKWGDLKLQYESISKLYWRTFHEIISDSERARLHLEFKEELERVRIECADLLLPHQEDRLGELYFWWFARRFGLVNLVERYGVDLGLNSVHLSVRQIQDLKPELVARYLAKAKDRYDEAKETIAMRLPVNMRRTYRQYVREDYSPLEIDVVLTYAEDISSIDPSFINRDDREQLVQVDWLELDFQGNWQARSTSSIGPLSVLQRRIRDSFALQGTEGSDGLGITANQIAQLDHLVAAYADEYERIDMHRRLRTELGEDEDEIRDEFRSRKQRLDDESFDALWSEILSDRQTGQIIAEVRDRIRRMYGPCGILLCSEDDDGNEITDQDRREMESVIREELDQLRVDLAKYSEELLEELIDSISDDNNQRHLRAAFGERPTFLKPSLAIELGDFQD